MAAGALGCLLRLGVVAEYRTGARSAVTGRRTGRPATSFGPRAVEAVRVAAPLHSPVAFPAFSVVTALDARSWTSVSTFDVDTGSGPQRARLVEPDRQAAGVVGWDVLAHEVVDGTNCAAAPDDVLRAPGGVDRTADRIRPRGGRSESRRMPDVERLRTLAWQYTAGLVPNEELPTAAAGLLAAGLDSPALRRLAGLSRRDGNAELFSSLLGEFGLASPDEGTAERCVLHHLAERLTAGAATPRETADVVWRRLHAGRPEAERAFVDAVGPEYHVEHIAAELPEAFAAWEERLHSAARRLRGTAFPVW